MFIGCRFGWSALRREARLHVTRVSGLSCLYRQSSFTWRRTWIHLPTGQRGKLSTPEWREWFWTDKGHSPDTSTVLSWQAVGDLLHMTLLRWWGFRSSSWCAAKMARVHLLILYFKFNLAIVLKTLTEIVLLCEAQLSPSITFEPFSLGPLLNFLYSGNLISNKEPDWSVEYEFYCCVETWFYCAIREKEI